jgi:hypothetical protein
MHVFVDCLSNRCKAFEILGIRGDNDVTSLVPRITPNAPSAGRRLRQIHLRVGQATEDLIEGWSVHLRRAAPANWTSWWLKAMVSARFTLIGRLASDRSR